MLSACTSKPRLVTASMPLVLESAKSLPGTKIPQTYGAQLDQPYTSVVSHSQYDIMVKPTYVSALGNECRELLIREQDQSHVRIACVYIDTISEQREWRLMPALDSNTSTISL